MTWKSVTFWVTENKKSRNTGPGNESLKADNDMKGNNCQ